MVRIKVTLQHRLDWVMKLVAMILGSLSSLATKTFSQIKILSKKILEHLRNFALLVAAISNLLRTVFVVILEPLLSDVDLRFVK